LVLGDEKLAYRIASEDGRSGPLPIYPPQRQRACRRMKSLARSAKDEAEAEAIAKLSMKPTGIASKQRVAADQLQGSLIQNPPIRYRTEQEPSQAFGGRLGRRPSGC